MRILLTILFLFTVSIYAADSWKSVNSTINELAIYEYNSSLGPRIDLYFDNDPDMLFTIYKSSFGDPQSYNALITTLMTAYSTGEKIYKIWGHPNGASTKYYILGVRFCKETVNCYHP